MAREAGVPLATVESRLQRGREMLRENLDGQSGGDRDRWCLALLPFLQTPGGKSASFLGALFVGTKTKLTALVVAVIAVAFAVQKSPEGTLPPADAKGIAGVESEVSTATVPTRADPLERVEQDNRSPLPEVKQLDAVAIDSSEPTLESEQTTRRVFGKVIDVHCAAVAGVDLAFTASEGATSAQSGVFTTDAAGEFSFEVTEGVGYLSVTGNEWVNCYAGFMRPEWDGDGSVVVVARPMHLFGEVQTQTWDPVAQARIRLELPVGFDTGFGVSLENSQLIRGQAFSDDDGGFDLGRVARIPGAHILVEREGFEAFEIPQPDEARYELRVTLIALGEILNGVSGRVVGQDGLGIAGARVAYGLATIQTDRAGRFVFRPEDVLAEDGQWWQGKAYHEIVAAAEGYLPVRSRANLSEASKRPAWPEEVLLVMDAPALSIRGRVLDTSGQPLEGLSVYVADTELIGRVKGAPRVLESVLLGQDGQFRSIVKSDANGRFELHGLSDRKYKVTATDEMTLINHSKTRVAAGTQNLEIVFDAQEVWKEVSGVVQSDSGVPLDGISLTPGLMLQEAQFRGVGVTRTSVSGLTVKTNARGEFTLLNIPRQAVSLRINGQDIVPIWHMSLPPAGHASARNSSYLRNLEVVVSVRLRAWIELQDPGEADRFEMLDANGVPLVINVDLGQNNWADESMPLEEGKSHVFSVSDAADTLVLSLEGEEVRRVPVNLAPGVLNHIDGR